MSSADADEEQLMYSDSEIIKFVINDKEDKVIKK